MKCDKLTYAMSVPFIVLDGVGFLNTSHLICTTLLVIIPSYLDVLSAPTQTKLALVCYWLCTHFSCFAYVTLYRNIQFSPMPCSKRLPHIVAYSWRENSQLSIFVHIIAITHPPIAVVMSKPLSWGVIIVYRVSAAHLPPRPYLSLVAAGAASSSSI